MSNFENQLFWAILFETAQRCKHKTCKHNLKGFCASEAFYNAHPYYWTAPVVYCSQINIRC